MQIIVYGIINSLIFALIALGFTLVYGISRIPNFAHGAFYILTGYLVWYLYDFLNIPYYIAIITAICLVTLIGALTYRLLLSKIRGLTIPQIIATFAVGLTIMEVLRWTGSASHTSTLPVFVQGTISISGITVEWQRFFIILACAALVILLWSFVRFTRMGIALRAIAQNSTAAQMLGIDFNIAATVAMALGSSTVALAAVFVIPLGNINVEAGYTVLYQSLAICVIGGLGSIIGTLTAALILGFGQVLTVNILGAQWQMVIFLLGIIIILFLKPSGLFGKQKEIEERV